MTIWIASYAAIGFLIMCFVMAGAMIRVGETRPSVLFLAGVMAGGFWPGFLMALFMQIRKVKAK